MVSLGAFWSGVALGVPGFSGVCVGCVVLGVVWGLVCVSSGVDPDGVLLGVVLWATTQTAESSNAESNVALDFMTVSHLRVGFISRPNSRRDCGGGESGGPSRSPNAFPYSEFAEGKGKNYV